MSVKMIFNLTLFEGGGQELVFREAIYIYVISQNDKNEICSLLTSYFIGINSSNIVFFILFTKKTIVVMQNKIKKKLSEISSSYRHLSFT